MNPLIRDLYGHQIWADAEHFRAIGAHPAARDDNAIRDRLHHIAIVQRAFLWAVGDRQEAFTFTKPDDFPSFDALKRYACEHHDRLTPVVTSLSDTRLAESIAIPWFNDAAVADDRRGADAGGAAQPLPSGTERHTSARDRRRTTDDRLHILVVEGTSPSGLDV
jgi:hypothetical protein